jgi:hypothetical protein
MGKLNKTQVGIGISVLYAALLISTTIWRWEEVQNLKLNELGDFAAGAFGPMAILWLVLGYFQQGEELKQNTEALNLQAYELKNSVEQQQALVDIARKQMRREKLVAEAACRPSFEISIRYLKDQGENFCELRLLARNTAKKLRELKAKSLNEKIQISKCYILENDINTQDFIIALSFDSSKIKDTSGKECIALEYIDEQGMPNRQIIKLDINNDFNEYSSYTFNIVPNVDETMENT